MNGKIELSSSGGDIIIKNTTGNVAASTSGGEVLWITLKVILILKLQVVISNQPGSKAIFRPLHREVKLKLIGGNGKIDAGTSGGNVELDYTGQNMGILLETSGGDINLKLPSDFSAHARMSTSGGSIHCDFSGNNATNISSSKYEADLNNGGNGTDCENFWW